MAFAATAFHDPPLTLHLLLTCLAAAHDRWTVAGVCAALAIATKQSSVQYLPVFLAIGLGAAVCSGWRWRDNRRRLAQFGWPVAVCALILAVWSAIRAAPTDFWTLGIANPGLLRFTRPDEILPRLRRWLELLGYVAGFAPLLAFGVIAPLLARPKTSRRAMLTALMAAGVLATLLMYWVVASNTYDRYLHPLAPLVLLLVAVGIVALSQGMAQRWRYALPLASVLFMLPWTAAALRGELPIGGDHGEHAEITALAAAVNALPQGRSSTITGWVGSWAFTWAFRLRRASSISRHRRRSGGRCAIGLRRRISSRRRESKGAGCTRPRRAVRR